MSNIGDVCRRPARESETFADPVAVKIIRHLNRKGHSEWAALTGNGTAQRIKGDIFGDFTVTDLPVDSGVLLAPVVPRTILCIGLNYRRHAEETGAKIPSHPVLFMKQPTAVQSPGAQIEIPRHLASERVDFEGELAVVIGTRCKNVGRENALDFVLGYMCANDVSARDWQKERGGSQWCRGKTFDTFAPLGPCLVTRDEIPDPSKLTLRTTVSGELMQESPLSDMIFDVPTLIEFLSGSTTLEPGTVILTGTPSGVGMARNPPRWLKPGDVVSVEIEGIGTLANPVVLEPI